MSRNQGQKNQAGNKTTGKQQPQNPQFEKTQEEMKIKIGNTIEQVMGTTVAEHGKELEQQFDIIIDADDLDSNIVQHIHMAEAKLKENDEHQNFSKAEWIERVSEMVLESYAIAQPLTKDDRELVLVTVRDYIELQQIAQKEESSAGGESENVLLITQQKMVNPATNEETPIGAAPVETKPAEEPKAEEKKEEENKDPKPGDAMIQRSFAFMHDSQMDFLDRFDAAVKAANEKPKEEASKAS